MKGIFLEAQLQSEMDLRKCAEDRQAEVEDREDAQKSQRARGTKESEVSPR